MFIQRGTTHLMMVIAAVIMPSAGALTWYYFSNDPTVRPLGITQESLRAYSGDSRVFEIVAEITGTQRGGNPSRLQIQRAITGGFEAKGVDVRIAFQEGGAAGTWITYRIGPSTIGPYPYARAVEGINAAVEAYRMSVPYEP